jgi:hypothetical protein
VDIGILEEDYNSEWESSKFYSAKKNGTIKFVSDLKITKLLIQTSPFTITKIGDIINYMEGHLCHGSGFKFGVISHQMLILTSYVKSYFLVKP